MTENDDNQFEEPPPVESASDPGHPAPEAAPPGPDPKEQMKALKEKASEAFKTGTTDAREAFDKQFPQVKEEFAKGVNDASYAIGYAVSFGSTLIKELSPDNVTDGYERGTQAGSKAAEEVIEHRKARSADIPDDPEPTNP
jgi:hypothetical protein